MRRRVRFFTDKRGKWRWQEVALNNRITAVSGQGYSRLESARESWQRHTEEVIRGHRLEVDDGSPQA